jgi:uncharacterized protein (TIGR03382 family)
VTISLDQVDGNVFTHVGAAQGTCNGDSGGPVFITRNGQEEIAGITSYGDDACQQFSSSTRVDTDLDFLDEQVALADPTTGCSMSSHATPSAAAFLLVGLLLVSARRRLRS